MQQVETPKMGDIRCKECNEINDCNSFKCERCKAILYDASEIDECEHDYRFIEEAELKGEVYKLEIVEDENRLLEGAPVDGNFSIKLEEDASTDSIIEGNERIPNGNDVNKGVKLRTELRKATQSKSTEKDQNANQSAAYQCDKCPKSFKRKASLKAHFNRIHSPDGSSKCFDSIPFEDNKKRKSNSMRISSPSFSESYDSDYEPPEEDSLCNISAKQSKSPAKTKRILEQISDESDSENNNPRKKLSTRCKVKTSPSQTLLDLKQNAPPLKRHMVYKCTACEKITNNYKEHIKHIAIHEAPVDSLTETTSLEKLKKAPSGFLKCKQCEEVFMTERDYKTHMKIHKAEKVFQCENCEALLVSQSSLRKHMIRMHKRKPKEDKDKHYDCNICNEKFSAQILLIHHRKTHMDVIKKIEEMTLIDRGGGKPIYVCKVCAKTSKNKFRHEEHLRIHTKEKPFKCEQCDTRVSTSNAMAHHRRLHENDRPFKCNICKATYRHKKSLKKHLILHTGAKPFKCRYCEKTYAFNYTRASHERNCHIGDAKTRQRRGRIGPASEGEEPSNETVEEGSMESVSGDS